MDGTPLRIAIGTAPSGNISLEGDIRLVKPALLYADKVLLYSPTASLVTSTLGLIELNNKEMLQLTEHVVPIIQPKHAPSLLHKI